MASTEAERRRWNRRQVDFLVRLIFPTRGIKDVHEAALRLQDLSEGGASILSRGLRGIPDFFYMRFDDEDHAEMVGCYVVERGDKTVHCQFWNEMSSEEIDRIVARKEAAAMLDELFSGEELGGAPSAPL